jgi:hypothetical protein
MTIEDVIPGGTRSFVGNATVGNHELNLTISYVPKTNTSTNQEYFSRYLSLDGNTFTGTSTAAHPGSGFSRAEFATDVMTWNPGETKYFTINRASLQYGSNIFPPFVEFQNGITTSDGVNIPPPSSQVQGQGFTVLTGNNTVFFGDCSYASPGFYTQRNYIAPLGVDDYSNYQDLTVFVSNASQSMVCVSGNDCINGVCTGTDCAFSLPSNNTGDSVNNALNNGASSAGLGPGTKLFIWLVISVVLVAAVALLLRSHEMLATIIGCLVFLVSFAVGIYYGWVPLWIAIVASLVAGALFVFVVRRVITGGE